MAKESRTCWWGGDSLRAFRHARWVSTVLYAKMEIPYKNGDR
jgi:hypothetical protein